MSKVKTMKTKATLGKKMNQNRRIPLFVIARTNRRITQNSERRMWRTHKLKMQSQIRDRKN